MPATVTKKTGKAKAAPKLQTPAVKLQTPTPSEPSWGKFSTTEDEFKGHKLLQFWADGNNGRYSDLQCGVKKLKVIMAIVNSEHLQDCVLDFIDAQSAE